MALGDRLGGKVRSVVRRARRDGPLDIVFVLFNAGDEDIDFHLPRVRASPSWDLILETGASGKRRGPIAPGEVVTVQARAMAVLGAHLDEEEDVDHSAAASVARSQP